MTRRIYRNKDTLSKQRDAGRFFDETRHGDQIIAISTIPRRRFPMRSGYVVALSIVAVFAAKGLCVSGFAVSSSESKVGNSVAGCENGGNALFFYGPIVKYTIESDNVTRCDTIYKQFRATYPHLNLQGTRCAFIRRSIGPTDSTHGVDDIFAHLSVMDINGGNVRDLDSFRMYQHEVNPYAPAMTFTIDWPAGDYIYYNKAVRYCPVFALGETPANQIWRVKYNDPSSKQMVNTYYNAHTWSLSLDATRAGGYLMLL
jgi:hypothetical protein